MEAPIQFTLVALTTALHVVSIWFPFIQLAKPFAFNQLTKFASGIVTYCASALAKAKHNAMLITMFSVKFLINRMD